MRKCIYWKRDFIDHMRWASLKKSAKSILPVMLAFSDENICKSLQNNLVSFSGRDEKTVRAGINDLRLNEIITLLLKIPTKKWDRNQYSIQWDFNPTEESFCFNTSIIKSGNWKNLRPAAQALYPVMLCFGEEDNADGEGGHMICNEKNTMLAKYAGIDRRSMKSAVESLEKEGLVKRLKNRSGWKIM